MSTRFSNCWPTFNKQFSTLKSRKYRLELFLPKIVPDSASKQPKHTMWHKAEWKYSLKEWKFTHSLLGDSLYKCALVSSFLCWYECEGRSRGSCLFPTSSPTVKKNMFATNVTSHLIFYLLSKLLMYLSKLQNIFVQITKCICPHYEIFTFGVNSKELFWVTFIHNFCLSSQFKRRFPPLQSL